AADGRDQPGRAARVLHQLALRSLGRGLLPERRRRVDGEGRRRPRVRGHDDRRGLLPPLRSVPGPPGAPDAPAGRGRLERLVLLRRLAGRYPPSRSDMIPPSAPRYSTPRGLIEIPA